MKTINVMFMNIAQDNKNRFWFFDKKKQFIGYMLCDFKRVYPVRRLRKDVDQYFHADNLFFNDEKIFITSRQSVQVIVYDILGDIFTSYENDSIENQIYNTIYYNNQILFLPFNITTVARVFDITTGKFSEKKWFQENSNNERVEHLFRKNEKLYLPIIQTNCVIELNLIDYSYEKIWIMENVSLCSVLLDGDGIWITQNNTGSIMYCTKGGQCYRYNQEEMRTQTPYISIVNVGNKVVVIPKTGDEIVLIENNKSKKIKIHTMQNRDEKCSLFSGFCVIENKLILFPWGQELMYELDCTTEKLIGYEMQMSTVDYYTAMAKMNMYERKETDLEEFIEYVQDLDV